MSAKHFKIWIFQQEPGGTGAEILNGIKYVRPGGGYVPQFMMFEKIDVNGDKEHPLYTYLKVPVIILLLYDLKKKTIYTVQCTCCLNFGICDIDCIL